MVEQESDRAARVAADGFRRLRAVRKARRVAEVEEPLVREPVRDRVEDGQPAHARVEEADGPVVAHVVSPFGLAGGFAGFGGRGAGVDVAVGVGAGVGVAAGGGCAGRGASAAARV